jgi:DNA-binding beta-propeller fold protein YncE
MIPDVSIGWSGNLYAASWGNNSFFVMDANWDILTQIGGEEGAGPGQFGKFSPQAITVDLDENIYVLDENEDANGEKFVRVQVFDQQGNYLFEFPITEDFFGATDIEFNPVNDRLYVLGFLGDCMLEYDLEGNLIGRFAEGVINSSQRVDVDIKGNFYVSTWTERPVLKLDPEGSLAAEFGEEVELSGGSYPEGAFAQPSGIAVAREGYPVYVADWSGEYFHIVAFEFK